MQSRDCILSLVYTSSASLGETLQNLQKNFKKVLKRPKKEPKTGQKRAKTGKKTSKKSQKRSVFDSFLGLFRVFFVPLKIKNVSILQIKAKTTPTRYCDNRCLNHHVAIAKLPNALTNSTPTYSAGYTPLRNA